MMHSKTFLPILLIFAFVFSAQAQDCNTYYRFIKDATYEYGYFDKKGKPEGRDLHTITDVSEDADGTYRATVHSKFIPAKKKQDPVEATSKIKCKGGLIELDLSLMMSQMMTQYKDMEVSMDGTPLEIPYDLSVGQTLPDAETKIKTSMNGMNLPSVTMSVTDREVEGKETITTPAGTFECFKITQTTKIKSIVGQTFKTAEYYSEGVGMIRTDTFSKSGKLESRRELLSLSE